MSGEVEAVGAAITAGLAANSIERPGAGDGRQGDHGDCLNCGATLAGEFCHACGQPSHISRKLADVGHDFLHGVLHFDTKAWKTLPLLFFRPGTLTRRYILGERARFIGPVALFLFTVFLMFFVFAFAAGEAPRVTTQEARSVAQLETELTEARAAIAEAEAEVQAARTETGPGASGMLAGAEAGLVGAQAGLRRMEQDLAEARARRDLYASAQSEVRVALETARAANDTARVLSLEGTLEALDRAVAGDGREVAGLEITEEGDDLNVEYSRTLTNPEDRNSVFDEIRRRYEAGEINVNTGSASFDEKIRHKLENPELAWYKIQNAAYKFSWLLIPISIPFVALLFIWKRGVTWFDHAVFVLYSLSFVSFAVILIVLATRFLPEAASGPIPRGLAFLIPVHMVFQLKGGYALGWWSTLWRSVFLWFFALFCLVLFLAAIVLLGLVG